MDNINSISIGTVISLNQQFNTLLSESQIITIPNWYCDYHYYKSNKLSAFVKYLINRFGSEQIPNLIANIRSIRSDCDSLVAELDDDTEGFNIVFLDEAYDNHVRAYQAMNPWEI